jgi:hypothetical protein
VRHRKPLPGFDIFGALAAVILVIVLIATVGRRILF